MTPGKVVDASALAALLFEESAAAEIVARLGEAHLMAPALLWFEIANVCMVKSRRHKEEAARFAEAFRMRERLAIEIVAVDHDAVLALAAETGLTAYDANYLWLARHMDAELITLDKRLAAAAMVR